MGVSHLLAQSLLEGSHNDFYAASPPYYQKRQRTDNYQPDRYAMANFCYASPPIPSVEEDDLQWAPTMIPDMSPSSFDFPSMSPYTDAPLTPDLMPSPVELLPPVTHSYAQSFNSITPEQSMWMAPQNSTSYPSSQHPLPPFPTFSSPASYGQNMPLLDAVRPAPVTSAGYLSPVPASVTRGVRATSMTSNNSSGYSAASLETPRSSSPNVGEMARWGFRNDDGSWSCAYPGCSSRSTFHRGCDLRKHYKRHSKTLFCRTAGCPQATEGGFSSKKDRARHEAKHNPNIVCEWDGCDRLFSRVDNMKDHIRRVHKNRSSQ